MRNTLFLGSRSLEGLGVCLAVVLSYTANHHIIWAICHGILSWFYVAYRVLGYGV